MVEMMIFKVLYVLIIIYILQINCEKYDKCKICKEVSKNIEKMLNETSQKTFSSGSVEWDKKHSVKYEDSELRFLKIIENACNNVVSDEKTTKCNSFIEDHEEIIENWFKKNRNNPFHDEICVKKLELCCPPNHYGKDCKICRGYVDGVMCLNRGKCKGDGHRNGNGRCSCNKAYTGDMCTECSEKSFRDSKGDCTLCHEACEEGCVKETAEGCIGKCAHGWKKNDKDICEDIDECLETKNICKIGQRCENTPGRYECRDCPENCLTCFGDNEDNCISCKKGYNLIGTKCVDIDECSENKSICNPKTYCKNMDGSYKCLKCHSACDKSCIGSEIKDCLDCRDGYIFNSTSGCEDINECENNPSICKLGTYCKNKIGGYTCKSCNEQCKHCYGPGFYNCLSCNEGYSFHNGSCIDISLTDDASDKSDNSEL